jgi:hypothetical protein
LDEGLLMPGKLGNLLGSEAPEAGEVRGGGRARWNGCREDGCQRHLNGDALEPEGAGDLS